MRVGAAIVAVLVLSVIVDGRPSATPPVLNTEHFAFYSDLQTNVHDALIEASGARRAKQPELFQRGPEKACFDGLSPSDRDGWTSAVDAYGSRRVTSAQRVNIRLELAGLLRRSRVTDPADISFLGDTLRNQMAATPAYRRCRWPAQDTLNRDWVAKLKPLLARYEKTLGRQLPMLFQTPWVGLPFRVDVVNSAPPTGGNSASPDGDSTLHILASSANAANQGDGALEVVFHEATHALTREHSPLAAALGTATRETGIAVPPDLLHSVHFFMTGEVVRRAFAGRHETYTPDLFRLSLFSDRFRDVVARTWPAYIDGKRPLDEVARDLVRGLATPGQ